MVSPLDYSRYPIPSSRTAKIVNPIIDSNNPIEAITQIFDFLRRRVDFAIGVPDTKYFPFSAICRLEITFPSVSGHGTGFYIAPDLILTAGHNLNHAKYGLATAVTIKPGQNDTSSLNSFSASPSDWTVHPTYVSNLGNVDSEVWRAYDMAVIRVQQAPPNGEYFELINYSPSPEVPVAVCGYSGSNNSGMHQHLDIDRVRRLSANGEIVEYNLQTQAGGSGSPVFAEFTNDSSGGSAPSMIPVMGVHVAFGDDEHNRGVLLTPDKIDWARGGGIMSVAQSFGGMRREIGGLPLVQSSRTMIGGLPLHSPSSSPIAAVQRFSQPFKRAFIVVDKTKGMSTAKRTFGHPSRDKSGKTSLKVSVPNLPRAGTTRWNIPDADDRKRLLFEDKKGGTDENARGNEVKLQALAGGLAHVDCSVFDSSNKRVESNKYLVSVPQFVFVAIDPSVDTFFNTIGLATRSNAIFSEMRSIARAAYKDVNIRLVFPGDTLPLHLGLASDPSFPGDVEVKPSVFYAEIIADDAILDPERTRTDGTPRTYRSNLLGRHHAPGEMDAPLNNHSLARSLLHRYRLISEVEIVEDAVVAGGLSASDLDLAATMYGRLLGENVAHEIGHFAHGAFLGHIAGGLMERGGGRSFEERTGMTPGPSGGAILIDNGAATINALSVSRRRTFEDVLPVKPPLDIAEERSRGRVGSFAIRRGLAMPMGANDSHADDSQIILPNGSVSQSLGWVNGALSRPMSGEKVHLPGTSVLSGWKAKAFIKLLDTALGTAIGGPAGILFTGLVNTDAILKLCDRYKITIGVGPGLSGGMGGGASFGYGIIFAPGRQIGFYGSYSGIIGWIASIGVALQLTIIKGSHEQFGGSSFTMGVSVETVGWFTTGVVGAPVGAHAVINPKGEAIGLTLEVGVSLGEPVVSLIEGYGQAIETSTSFSMAALPAPAAENHPETDAAKEDAIRQAVEGGASEAEASAFINALFCT